MPKLVSSCNGAQQRQQQARVERLFFAIFPETSAQLYTRDLAMDTARLQVLLNPEETFYKDEGGKGKCMVAEIGLTVSPERRARSLDPVPLTVQLLYEDGNLPYQQQILTISPDSDLSVTSDAPAVIRFRIEERVRATSAFLVLILGLYKGSRFKLLIGPDTKDTTQFAHVATCCTEPILVLSKRKNLTAKAAAAAATASSSRSGA
eukprot:9493-Heterococcus_DN1.PRE.2